MIDSNEIIFRTNSCEVYFRNLPDGFLNGAIYIENQYHVKMNRYLRRWGWWLQKTVFHKFENGNIDLLYIPKLSSKIKSKKRILYQFPYISKDLIKKIPDIKTSDLLVYLEDPDDTRFLKPGFLFFKKRKDNEITVYDYYPLVGLENKALSYKKQIVEILKAHNENADKNIEHDSEGIGNSGALFCKRYNEDENYADNMFDSWDDQTIDKLYFFAKQIVELRKSGVPMAILENILHQNEKISKLVITKNNEIIGSPVNSCVYPYIIDNL